MVVKFSAGTTPTQKAAPFRSGFPWRHKMPLYQPSRRAGDVVMKTLADPILLIEDEPSVTAFVRAALERRGYTVIPAASGAEGLARLADTSFGGVISDIRMPGAVNGAEVHDWIRAHRP